jgi:thiol-disulfide isomerase/thioredoxin
MNKKITQIIFSAIMMCALNSSVEATLIHVKSATELQTELDKGNYVVVYFSSQTCGPCKAFNPIFEEIARQFPDVIFIKVVYGLVQGCEVLLNKYGIRSFPTFVFFDKDGKKTNSFSGANDNTKGKIIGEIAKLKAGVSTQQTVVSTPVKPGSQDAYPSQQQPEQPVMAQNQVKITYPEATMADQPMQRQQAQPTKSPRRKMNRRPRQRTKPSQPQQ